MYRLSKAESAAWAELVEYVSLAVMKGVIGWLSFSKVLIADAVHSASYAVGSIRELMGVRTAKAAVAEKKREYAEKAETMVTLVSSVVLMIAGGEIAVYALKAIAAGVHEAPHWAAPVTVAVAVALKEVLMRYRRARTEAVRSPEATWKRRSDIYVSIVALIGVFGPLGGSLFGLRQLYYLEPIAALFISATVFLIGCRYVMELVHKTAQPAAYTEDTEEMIKTVMCVKGVISVDELSAKETGHYITVHMRISVNPKISVMEGHEIARRAKELLLKRFIHVIDVDVHVAPYDPGYPYKTNVDSVQEEFPTLLH